MLMEAWGQDNSGGSNPVRTYVKRLSHNIRYWLPINHQPTNSLGSKWAVRLAILDANHDAEQPVSIPDRKGTGRVRKAVTARRRKPTPLQTARWKAAEKAKRKGLSMREIARELGIH